MSNGESQKNVLFSCLLSVAKTCKRASLKMLLLFRTTINVILAYFSAVKSQQFIIFKQVKKETFLKGLKSVAVAFQLEELFE